MSNENAEKTQLARKIFTRLNKRYGPVSCPLTYNKDYELAIAVILSAQCTDERVNMVTPELFKRFPNLKALAQAPIEDVEQAVYTTGFYRNKAKNIQALAQRLLAEHDGKMPATMDELVDLPGIGRKTANVILSEYFRIAVGITVDTHVMRLAGLWGFTTSKNAVIVERDLMRIFPEKTWLDISLLIIFLGREFCTARRRECALCPLQDVCPAADTTSVAGMKAGGGMKAGAAKTKPKAKANAKANAKGAAKKTKAVTKKKK